MATLFEQVKDLFTENFITKAAATWSESEPNMQQALNTALPVIFSRLVQKTDNAAGNMDVYNMSMMAAESGAATDPATLLSGGDLPGISEIDTNLFGDKLAALGHGVSVFAHIRQSSAVSILTVVGVSTLSFLGLLAHTNGYSAADLGQMIQSQKEDLHAKMPPGFNITGTLGLNTVNPSAPAMPGRHASLDTAQKSKGWIVLTVFLLVVLALIWYFMKSCNEHKTPSPAAVPKTQEP